MSENEVIRTAGSSPCHNSCIVKGTENNEPPSLMGATHGHFCDKEYHAIKTALEAVAEVVEHVVAQITGSGGSDDRVDGSKTPPLPFNEQAFNDANETYGRLVYWATHWAGVLKRQAPGAAKRAWRQTGGNVVGLPADVTPSNARYATSTLAIWLDAHLDDIMWQTPEDDVTYFRDELADVYRIAARWPFEMKPRFANIRCREDQSRIAVYPPADLGATPKIRCESGQHTFTEDEFEAEVRAVKAERDADHKAGKVAARLARKYVA